ncbi:MAG: DNA repair protein RecO [Ruminococcaceae bacterium]|nr:DNA repair protein RecO [Oscillospiraceae bacterium]
MEVIVTGIVLKTTDAGDFDKLITVLTEYGKVTFRAFGVRLMKSANASACMEFAYSEFTLTVKDGMCRLKNSRLIKTLIRPGKSLSALSLAFYVAEVCLFASTDFPLSKDESRIHDDGLFTCAANALYLVSKSDREILLVKSVFELRLASILGFSPDLPYCSVCGDDCSEKGGYVSVHLVNGNMQCARCNAESFMKAGRAENTSSSGGASDPFEENTMTVSSDALMLIMRTLSVEEKKAYAVSVPEILIKEFASFTEKYLLNQLERGFKSLTYFKDIYSYESNI